MLNNAELLAEPVQIVIAGTVATRGSRLCGRPHTASRCQTAVVSTVAPGDTLPEGHPAYGKGLVDGAAAAYVCVGPVCSLPLNDAEKLLAHLAEIR